MPRALCTYTTRSSDSFTVPDGVSSVTLDVVGAERGHYFIAGDAAHGDSPTGNITGNPGGNGGEATGILVRAPDPGLPAVSAPGLWELVGVIAWPPVPGGRLWPTGDSGFMGS